MYLVINEYEIVQVTEVTQEAKDMVKACLWRVFSTYEDKFVELVINFNTSEESWELVNEPRTAGRGGDL